MRISEWSSDVCSSDLLPEDGAIAPLTRRYLSQHQALQYLALDDVENALPFIQDALTRRTDLLPGFRMVAAARLAALDRKYLALALLKIRNKDAARLSRNIEAVRKPRPQVRTAAQGYARLLFQLAEDLSTEHSRSLALSIARLAAFADPTADEYRIGVARELLATDHASFALRELQTIESGSPFASAATDVRIAAVLARSEEHTTEFRSLMRLSYAV